MKRVTYEYGNWDPIIEMFRKADALPKKPDPKKFKWYSATHVFDEDKSVKWNIQEATRRNEAYDSEYKRLKNEYNETIAKTEGYIIEAVSDYICNVIKLIPDADKAYEKAKIIYRKAYEESHSYGLREVLCTVEDLVDFLESVMK